jgi:DNA-binding transcriptional regulator YdaS (Cro superfamily)
MVMTYAERVLRLSRMLGGQRALARRLGLGHSTIKRRSDLPETVKAEHELALEALEKRLGVSGG